MSWKSVPHVAFHTEGALELLLSLPPHPLVPSTLYSVSGCVDATPTAAFRRFPLRHPLAAAGNVVASTVYPCGTATRSAPVSQAATTAPAPRPPSCGGSFAPLDAALVAAAVVATETPALSANIRRHPRSTLTPHESPLAFAPGARSCKCPLPTAASRIFFWRFWGGNSFPLLSFPYSLNFGTRCVEGVPGARSEQSGGAGEW